MKIKFLFLLVLALISLSNCSKNEDDTIKTTNLLIDSERLNSTGISEQLCYKIQVNETVDEIFGNIIVQAISIENPPTDASSLHYKLIKIISKTPHE